MRDFGSSPHARRFASGIPSVMNVREDSLSDYGTTPENKAPLYTVQGRRKLRQKRWLYLFTCMETRAVHLEMAWGLYTDTFLNAFARFTSRHGVPEEVISDRGTNFVGTVGELKKLASQLDQGHLQSKTAEFGLMEIQSTRCPTYWRSP